MEQQPTCGEGLAQHAALPATLADVFGAIAENLEIHVSALDPTDKGSRPESDAYVALSTEHRELESRLRALRAADGSVPRSADGGARYGRHDVAPDRAGI